MAAAAVGGRCIAQSDGSDRTRLGGRCCSCGQGGGRATRAERKRHTLVNSKNLAGGPGKRCLARPSRLSYSRQRKRHDEHEQHYPPSPSLPTLDASPLHHAHYSTIHHPPLPFPRSAARRVAFQPSPPRSAARFTDPAPTLPPSPAGGPSKPLRGGRQASRTRRRRPRDGDASAAGGSADDAGRCPGCRQGGAIFTGRC